jgi:hypothetical protein
MPRLTATPTAPRKTIETPATFLEVVYATERLSVTLLPDDRLEESATRLTIEKTFPDKHTETWSIDLTAALWWRKSSGTVYLTDLFQPAIHTG